MDKKYKFTITAKADGLNSYIQFSDDPDYIPKYQKKPFNPDLYDIIRTDNIEDYRISRVKEYPQVSDQLDALYKKFHLGDSSEYDDLCKKISEIKTKYPKK